MATKAAEPAAESLPDGYDDFGDLELPEAKIFDYPDIGAGGWYTVDSSGVIKRF